MSITVPRHVHPPNGGYMGQPNVEVTIVEETPPDSPLTDESSVEAVEVSAIVALTERVTRIEDQLATLAAVQVATVEAVEEVAEEVSDVQGTAEIALEIAADAESAAFDAQSTAEVALEETEAVIDAAVDTDSEIGEELIEEAIVEPDVPAQPRTHWMFRSANEWKNR